MKKYRCYFTSLSRWPGRGNPGHCKYFEMGGFAMDNQTIKRRFRRGFSASLAIATALGLGLSDGMIVAPVNATVIAQAQEVSDTVTIQEVTYGEKYVETKATADDTINSPSASSNITSVTLSDGRTVSAKTYGEGEDAVTGVLTLVVDGVQCDILDYMQGKIELKEGTYSFESTKGSVAYSEMAKFGAMGGNTAQYTYRSALMIKDGEINADETIPSLLKSISEYTNTGMKGGTLKSEGAFFNGVIAEAEEQEEETTASATVNINSSEIYTSGVIRTAAAAKGNGVLNINDSVIYTQETEDTQEEYDALVVPMMKRTPFALGIEGVVRATNILGSGRIAVMTQQNAGGTISIKDSIVKAEDTVV
ncbi:MAG: hypothetical protein V8R80_10165 [Eubacterium sp.]